MIKAPLTIYACTILLLLNINASGAIAGGIVIDPGHSVKHPGATSCAGKPEYLYNNSLADSIYSYLSENNIPVSFTRKANEELSLISRARLARGNNLFLSIHHDSVQSQFISWSNKHPSSGKAAGFSIFISTKNIYYAQSLQYAKRLGSLLRSNSLKPSLHHAEKIAGENRLLINKELGIYQYDDLVVLKNAESPAILLEAAVIVNPEDELKASSPAYRKLVSEIIFKMLSE